MPTLYLTEDHALVRRDSEDCLLVQIPEKKDEFGMPVPAEKKIIPLAKVDEVVVMGDVTLTAAAILLLLEKNVEIHFLNYAGRFKGRLSPALSKNSLLRIAQHQIHHTITARGDLARRFAIGKLSNQRTMLQRYQRKVQEPALQLSIDEMAQSINALVALDVQSDTAPVLHAGDTGIASTPIETILGLEGRGSAAYFHSFGMMLSDAVQWPFPGRTRRPPTDPVNALLSLGYSMLTGHVSAAVQIVGFDPYVGYLHSSTYGRPALALDLMEEFRPLIVDSVVLTMLNTKIFSREDFVEELGAYRLKDKPRKIFIRRFEDRLNETIQHPVFGYKVTYRRCIELQARLVAKYITGEIAEYPPMHVR